MFFRSEFNETKSETKSTYICPSCKSDNVVKVEKRNDNGVHN